MKVGLVLSGGVAKGAYQAGFLKALEEQNNVEVIACSCASIGVFGGYCFSAKKTDELVRLWRSIHFDSSADLARNVWFHHFLKDMVNEVVREGDELSIPVYAPISYFPFLHTDYCRLFGEHQKRWYSFMRSAIAFPIITGNIRFFRCQISVDGGLMDNIPVQPVLYNEKPDLILVLHFEAGFRPRKDWLKEGVPIIDYDISIHNMFKKRSFDFHSDTIASMIDSGYEYGKSVCQDLFGKNGENSLQEVCENARLRRERELPYRLDNVTFDTWVRRMNELFYPLIKNEGRNIYDVKQKQPKTKGKENVIYGDEKMP